MTYLSAHYFYANSARLKNIEETEKAKRVVAEERQDRRKPNNDEEHLAASRCTIFHTTQALFI